MGERPLRLSRPKSTIRLDNLAQLSHALNRLVEAEPLMSRMVEILLRFTQTTGSPHPNLHAAYGNHAGLLRAMGHSEDEVRRILTELASRYGLKLD